MNAVTKEMVQAVNGGQMRGNESPVGVYTLVGYGQPTMAVTHDNDGKQWSTIWLRFSAVTPELSKLLVDNAWKYNGKRLAYNCASNNAQSQAFVESLIGNVPVMTVTPLPKEVKTKVETKVEASVTPITGIDLVALAEVLAKMLGITPTVTPDVAPAPTPKTKATPTPTPVKEDSKSVKRDGGYFFPHRAEFGLDDKGEMKSRKVYYTDATVDELTVRIQRYQAEVDEMTLALKSITANK